ncbi:hypothetical protein SMACR_03208 [Sordaria macrospora]|uniref:WGS project CABT00000000 data, contig 2.7 n=2 Tax=Sordaria macrospora TaxID=5147 RepID=F7VTX6_SORMK|nr:uncharacterized protein SMAC_03208 [Sordaria macrospora k-hell]KAA8635977.1 hypothetical protein SMACR_03208 [Sordaria macrospora]KAH7632741.1 hypothetical protein B0T09DRAFT_363457 [Sordaria sp. MPI-SDFR-AT-0083]WPJ60781.1 hypothetical protein SMAC4_03208 [Sordaria macrospora]CCC08964.1 unnamed protein product [Sordaria macrospora k-hell]
MSHLVHILPDDNPTVIKASKLPELFSSYRNAVKAMLLNLAAEWRNQASVRYIRDNGSDGSDDDDDGDNESDDDSGTSEHRDRFLAKLSAEWKAQCHPEMVVEPEPKLLALWNAFRNIPREHFSDVMQRSQSPGFSSIALGTRGRGSSLSETPRRLSLRKRDFARGFWRMIFDPTVYYGLELTEAPERSGGMLTHV